LFITALAQGLLLGVAVAAPIGAMSLLCMRRALYQGFAAGLVSAFGIATADAAYAALAAFTLVAMMGALVGQQTWTRVLGAVAILSLGIRTVRSRPSREAAPSSGVGLPGMYLSTLGLTLTNPGTILSFAALFLGLGLVDRGAEGVPSLVLGVFLGSAGWWLALTVGVTLARHRMPERLIGLLNTGSGMLLIALAVVIIWRLT
jgi:threonine/homoserine/homoserine lactone efflux protein